MHRPRPRRLIDSAERALVNGALATAEATARRARTLAEGDDDVTIDADELLVRVLAIAGNTAAAQTLGRALLARLLAADAPAARRVDLLLAMARAALTAGDLDAATEHTAAADGAAGTAADLRARVDTMAAAVALDEANLGEAERLSRLAIEEATATAQPETECEALLVLGRVVRARNVDDSEPWFEQAATLAAESGLPSWHLRAQQELAISRWPRGDIDALRDTRDLARRYGAMVTVAVMELSLADIALSNFDRDVSLAESRACVEASERYGLATATVAHLWLAGAHALASDDEAMQAEIDRALAPDPDDPRILGDVYGRVLTTRAFVADELATLPQLLDTMMPHVRRAPPTTSVFPGRVMWALVHTIDDDDLGIGPRALSWTRR